MEERIKGVREGEKKEGRKEGTGKMMEAGSEGVREEMREGVSELYYLL